MLLKMKVLMMMMKMMMKKVLVKRKDQVARMKEGWRE